LGKFHLVTGKIKHLKRNLIYLALIINYGQKSKYALPSVFIQEWEKKKLTNFRMFLFVVLHNV